MSLLSMPAGKPMGERKGTGHFVTFTLQSFVPPSLKYSKICQAKMMQISSLLRMYNHSV